MLEFNPHKSTTIPNQACHALSGSPQLPVEFRRPAVYFGMIQQALPNGFCRQHMQDM
jgi:hypothetical protein